MSKWTKVTVVILVLICGGIVISLYHARRYKQQEVAQQEGVLTGEQAVAAEQGANECGLDCGEAEEGAETIVVEEPVQGEAASVDSSAQEDVVAEKA